MSDLDSLREPCRLSRAQAGRLTALTAALVALAGATPVMAMRAGLPTPGVSAPAPSTASRATSTGSSSSSVTTTTGRTSGPAVAAAPAPASAKAPAPAPAPAPAKTAAPSPTPAAPAPTRITAAPAAGGHTPTVAVTTMGGPGRRFGVAAMMRAQPGDSRPPVSQVTTLNPATPTAASPGNVTGDGDRRVGAHTNGFGEPGAGRPTRYYSHATPGAGPAPTTLAPANPGAVPSPSTQGNSSNRYAASAGGSSEYRSSSPSVPARGVVASPAADTASRSSASALSAEVRPAPLAEIVPTAAEWTDARRQASAARVVPLSQTQTLAGGVKVARTADCVPTTFVPDTKRPGELSIGPSGRDVPRSISSTQDVARLFARTRFDGVDLGVRQSMCLPPDLAGRLAQRPTAVTTAAAVRPGVMLRAGKSRSEPATGAAG